VPWHRLEVEYALRHQVAVVEDEGELSMCLHGALQQALHRKISPPQQRGVQDYCDSERNVRGGKKTALQYEKVSLLGQLMAISRSQVSKTTQMKDTCKSWQVKTTTFSNIINHMVLA